MVQCIKDIGYSWLQSLKIFTLKQGKLFALVTLKAILESYKILFFKFWWLFLLCVGVDILYLTHSFSYYIQLFIHSSWFLLWCLLGFVTFMTIRPSLELKNYHYYLAHYWHFIDFVMYTIGARSWWFLLYHGINSRLFLIPALGVSLMMFMFLSPAVIPTIYISPFLMVLIFFSLDSKSNLWSQIKKVPFQALKMVIYNYPFFFIIAKLISFTWFMVHYFIKIIMQYAMTIPVISGMLTVDLAAIIANDFTKLILPIFFCLVCNFYIKEVHEQFKRYF